MNPQDQQQPQQSQQMAQAPMNPDHLASSLAFTTHIAEGLHQADPNNQPQQQGQPQAQQQPEMVSMQDFQKLIAELPKVIKTEVQGAVKEEMGGIKEEIATALAEEENEPETKAPKNPK